MNHAPAPSSRRATARHRQVISDPGCRGGDSIARTRAAGRHVGQRNKPPPRGRLPSLLGRICVCHVLQRLIVRRCHDEARCKGRFPESLDAHMLRLREPFAPPSCRACPNAHSSELFRSVMRKNHLATNSPHVKQNLVNIREVASRLRKLNAHISRLYDRPTTSWRLDRGHMLALVRAQFPDSLVSPRGTPDALPDARRRMAAGRRPGTGG
jgi:hypothetical protein